ncbi:GtrA family protein [uncultured Arcticibacterium sp.]|uniref:GtrA family protein n=1 Tax=uncultured Arcticibacterium sp. TaxID=2173042 RepID=UPI0030F82D6D
MSKFSAYQILKRRKTFIAYFFAATCGVVVQYVVGTIICIRYLGLPFNSGVSWGYLAAIPVGFFLSKNMAFGAKESGNTKIEILKYLVTLVFSYIITVKGAEFTLWSLTEVFGELTAHIPFTETEFSPIGTFSHFAGMGFSFIFNYLAHKKFTFA